MFYLHPSIITLIIIFIATHLATASLINKQNSNDLTTNTIIIKWLKSIKTPQTDLDNNAVDDNRPGSDIKLQDTQVKPSPPPQTVPITALNRLFIRKGLSVPPGVGLPVPEFKLPDYVNLGINPLE